MTDHDDPGVERPSIAPQALTFAGRALRQFRNFFVAGALVTVPTYVTFWVFHRFFLSLDGVLRVIPGAWDVQGVNLRRLLTAVPGLGALLTLLCIVLIGALATNFLGRRVISLSEAAIQRLPILSTIYQGVKQLLTTVFSGRTTRFDEVVYVEYPRREIWSLGFVTGPTFSAGNEAIGRECINVFVPTTPNPTSGFYLMVPRDDVITADLTVEQAFKLIMSAGLVAPDDEKTKKAT